MIYLGLSELKKYEKKRVDPKNKMNIKKYIIIYVNFLFLFFRLINTLSPGAVKKLNDGKMAFKMMENISNFLTAIEKYGVSRHDLFQTVDLYEGQNMVQVVNAIHALGRKVSILFCLPKLILLSKPNILNLLCLKVHRLRCGMYKNKTATQ